MDENREDKGLGDHIHDISGSLQKAGAARRLEKRIASAIAKRGIAMWAPFSITLLAILIPTFLILMGGQGAASEITAPAENQSPVSSQKFFTYFCQGSADWQSSSCDIGNNGCTPTSTAMILNTFGTKITPLEVAHQLFNDAGCNGATNFANFIDRFDSLGFAIGPTLIKYDPSYGGNGNKLNMTDAKSYLDKGYLILAASGPFKCFPTNSCKGIAYIEGHEFVIQDINISQNTITIRDPNSCSYGVPGNIEKPDYNIREATFSNFGNFMHAYPIKKI